MRRPRSRAFEPAEVGRGLEADAGRRGHRPVHLDGQEQTMKLRDVTRAAGAAHLHVWPPQVLAGFGTTFMRPGEGVLRSVRRIGNRLSLTIEHEGREATGFAG